MRPPYTPQNCPIGSIVTYGIGDTPNPFSYAPIRVSNHFVSIRALSPSATMVIFLVGLNGHAAPQPPKAPGSQRSAPLPATPVATPSVCPVFAPVPEKTQITNPALIEVSGLAASNKNEGVIWAHNDSGDRARLYSMTTTGRDLGTYVVAGASNLDWEDIAIGPGPLKDMSYLYVADTGTNNAARDYVSIYRIEEPRVTTAQKPLIRELRSVSRFDLTYADHNAYDSEALMVDPITADLYLVTKPREGSPVVFRASAPLLKSPRRGSLEPVATLTAIGKDWGFPAFVTAADISHNGQFILVRTYLRAYLWQRTDGETVEASFKRNPCPVPLALERQGEAIAFRADSQGYYTTSEGARPLLQYFQRR